MQVLIVAICGLLLGHALYLVYPRFYSDQRLGGPLEGCPRCHAALRPVYMLPLLGYALTLGRCRDCGERLPLRALVLPLGGAALFATSYFVFDGVTGGLLGGFFATVFLTLTLTDIERRLLPNRIVYPSVLIAVATSWAWPDSSAVEVLAGGLVALAIAGSLLIISLPFGEGAFGMGDVKMIVLIGFVVGLPSVLVGIVLGTVVAAVVALLLIALRFKTRKDYIPHGPFLALGAVIALFWGAQLWDGYRGN